MHTYKMNTSQAEIDAVVAQLTAKGRDTMRGVGNHETSYFDDGIVEGSGIWGEALTSELGHKSSGVINRLRTLGLWETSSAQRGDNSDWWYLTALGADVANFLAGALEAPAEETALAGIATCANCGGIHRTEDCRTPRQETPAETPAEDDEELLPDFSDEPSVNPTVKAGRKWTYIYGADGELIAELRNDSLELIGMVLRSQGLA